MISENQDLKPYNTFGISATAGLFAAPASKTGIHSLISSGILAGQRTFILGGGSNVLFTNDFDGIILHPVLMGIETGKTRGQAVRVTVGAGVVWDDFVNWAVSNSLTGTENLSLIPGSTGASAVQNIGAYGTEASEIIETVNGIDIKTGKEQSFKNRQCLFGYRESIFKGELKGRFVITSVTFLLKRQSPFNLSYGNLKEEVEKLGAINPANIRTAIISIRRSKLPDPEITGNAGSFFKNPLVTPGIAENIRKKHPTMPFYPAGTGAVKLAAGWLIEQCGWKGYRNGDAGVHDKQALVLVNHGNATGVEILKISEDIRASVAEKFGVILEPEVEII
jgi:UDP-N-acetylmuramate dehydrogenase